MWNEMWRQEHAARSIPLLYPLEKKVRGKYVKWQQQLFIVPKR